MERMNNMDSVDFEALREQAYDIRLQFRSGNLTVGEAKELLKPYEKAFNARAKEKAAAYGLRAQKFSVLMFLKMKV